MATVKFTNVQKIYEKGQTPAVSDFNLEIADKEFIVFVGPSGCGKSTTLRMLAGLEDISGVTIEIDGEVVNDLQPRDRNVAMVFQNYALYPHLTVFENMAFSLRLKKMKQDEVYRRVTEAAEILGITQYLTRKPRALSGGQRQRVAIGRAMVRDSNVFLMDEPLSNLDAKLRNQMRAEIILLRQKIDTTFVYVTHDQTEAMTLGDRIVIMKDGFIQQVGTPTEVFDMPVNLFVAEFIGAPKMNTFKTELVRENGEYFVKPFGAKIQVTGNKAAMLKEKNIESGEILLEGENLLALSQRQMQQRIRGSKIAMIFQDPMSCLNPVFTVGSIMTDVLQTRRKGLSRKKATQEAVKLLQEVKLADAESILSKYPHQLSGGQRQRVIIALALACGAELLIADEPTRNLDVTIQASILKLLKELQQKRNMTVLFIANNLSLVSAFCDRVGILYNGKIIEENTTSALIAAPQQEYTRVLLDAVKAEDIKERPLKELLINFDAEVMPGDVVKISRVRQETEDGLVYYVTGKVADKQNFSVKLMF